MGVAALFVVGLFAAYWFKPPPPKKNDDVVYVYTGPKNVLGEPQQVQHMLDTSATTPQDQKLIENHYNALEAQEWLREKKISIVDDIRSIYD